MDLTFSAKKTRNIRLDIPQPSVFIFTNRKEHQLQTYITDIDIKNMVNQDIKTW